jgi:hypothetical protein
MRYQHKRAYIGDKRLHVLWRTIHNVERSERQGAEPRQLSLSTSMARKLIAVESSSSVHDTRTSVVLRPQSVCRVHLFSLEGNEMVHQTQKENLILVVIFSNQGILFD